MYFEFHMIGNMLNIIGASLFDVSFRCVKASQAGCCCPIKSVSETLREFVGILFLLKTIIKNRILMTLWCLFDSRNIAKFKKFININAIILICQSCDFIKQ